MKRKMVLIVFLAVMLFVVDHAFSFCVYNFSDTTVAVEEVKGGKFGKSFFASCLKPGQKACCNWKNRDCNKEGKKDSILKFNVYYGDYKFICQNFPIKAGGWLVVKGKNKHYHCEAGF